MTLVITGISYMTVIITKSICIMIVVKVIALIECLNAVDQNIIKYNAQCMSLL